MARASSFVSAARIGAPFSVAPAPWQRGEDFLQRGRDDDADHRHVAVEAAERDAESLAAAHEIRGAVDRIDHPAQTARAGTATLLALEAVAWIGMRETFGQQTFDRAIGLGEPVLRSFQLRR